VLIVRLKAGLLVCLIFTSLLALVAYVTSVASDQAEALEAEASCQTFNGRVIARLISLESGANTDFVAFLSDCYLPVWQNLRTDMVVSSVSVFELSYYHSSTADTSVQDYLVLAELGPLAKPADLTDAEQTLACPGRQDALGFSVLRSVYMSCTPNSCYGMPQPTYQDAGTELHYLVELIGVEDTPNSLAKYRKLMSKYFGPANGALVESGMLHCFVALENTEVLFTRQGAVQWNQIHISDDWNAGGEVDWDSVYVDLFRNKFSCDLDSVWAELPPTDGLSADCRGRLIPQLCVR
jgi:hypothetical protein